MRNQLNFDMIFSFFLIKKNIFQVALPSLKIKRILIPIAVDRWHWPNKLSQRERKKDRKKGMNWQRTDERTNERKCAIHIESMNKVN